MVLLELVEKISPRNPPLRRTGNELYSAESPESNHTCPLWNQFLIPILLAFHSEHVRPRRVRRKGIFSAHLFNGRLSHPLLPEGEKEQRWADGAVARNRVIAFGNGSLSRIVYPLHQSLRPSNGGLSLPFQRDL